MHKIIVLFLFISLAGMANAQTSMDASVTDLLQSRKLNRVTDSTSQGYRILIYMGNNKNEAMQIKDKVELMFPGFPVYLKFEAPNFKVRVGDFRTRLECQPLFRLLMADFPNLLIVQDRINPPKP